MTDVRIWGRILLSIGHQHNGALSVFRFNQPVCFSDIHQRQGSVDYRPHDPGFEQSTESLQILQRFAREGDMHPFPFTRTILSITSKDDPADRMSSMV